MKLAVLFTGGKDSVYACHMAMKTENTVECLITLVSENVESYMFHTPNITRSSMLSEALGIPYLEWKTKGEKEKELKDLRSAINHAKEEYGIEGIVTGAIESVYQATRVQRICNDLDLWCFNPLWQVDQVNYLKNLVEDGFEVIISGVFAYPFDDSWLGMEIDTDVVEKLSEMRDRYKINPSGEGGELETFVIDGPIFKKRVEILSARKEYSHYSGKYHLDKLKLVKK